MLNLTERSDRLAYWLCELVRFAPLFSLSYSSYGSKRLEAEVSAVLEAHWTLPSLQGLGVALICSEKAQLGYSEFSGLSGTSGLICGYSGSLT